jgi:hypothetical protein
MARLREWNLHRPRGGLVKEAAANSGNVADATWAAAQEAGWTDKQLTDAFA